MDQVSHSDQSSRKESNSRSKYQSEVNQTSLNLFNKYHLICKFCLDPWPCFYPAGVDTYNGAKEAKTRVLQPGQEARCITRVGTEIPNPDLPLIISIWASRVWFRTECCRIIPGCVQALWVHTTMHPIGIWPCFLPGMWRTSLTLGRIIQHTTPS